MTPQPLLQRLDHLVYATAELDRGIAEIEQRLGVRAESGGRHAAWGTHNALLALGEASYLEIIAPDPHCPPAGAVRPFGLERRGPSGLVAWAAKASHLHRLRGAAARAGVMLGEVSSGERLRADGSRLAWSLTDLRCVLADGIVPFFIDWGRSVHPAANAPRGAALLGLRAQHPEVDRVRASLRSLAIDLPVEHGPAPALIAEIQSPKGRITLR